MGVGARIEDLEFLYDELVNSMNSVDAMIKDVQAKKDAADNEWKGTGKNQFHDAWETAKPQLTNLCRAFAAAGTDISQQHAGFVVGAKEQGQHRELAPVTSPR